jgi:hypothetical protein
MESGCRLVALQAIDGRQYVYWDVSDTAVIRRVG